MTTTSANIAKIPTPFMVTGRVKPWPYGGKAIYTLDELMPKKRRGKKEPLYYAAHGIFKLYQSESLNEASVDDLKTKVYGLISKAKEKKQTKTVKVLRKLSSALSSEDPKLVMRAAQQVVQIAKGMKAKKKKGLKRAKRRKVAKKIGRLFYRGRR